jgi:DNA helicase IV
MHDHGILDPRSVHAVCPTLTCSQSDAVIKSLSREIALIQGPPGTGKVRSAVHV